MAIDVTEATFQTEVVERSLRVPVIVDFWAPWCGPCLKLGPVLEKVVESAKGRVVLAKVNTDLNQELAKAFDVRGIPALFVAVGGQFTEAPIRSFGESEVQSLIDSVIAFAAQHGVVGTADESADAGSGLIVEAEQPAAEAPAPAAPPDDDYDRELEGLLPSVRTDEAVKARFLEILEAMGADDPRTAGWRRRLTAQLF